MSETPENNLPGGDQISEAFQKILQNPDIISNVAAAIGMPLPSRENGVGEKSGSGITADTDALTALTPLFNSMSKKDAPHKISSNQASLLRALKPYVNDNRCQAIDYIIRVAEISQLLKKIN